MRILVLMLALALSGCATYDLTVKGRTEGPDKAYSVELPQNWVRLTSATDKVIVTRDGFGLQRIMITRVAAKDAFPAIKKEASARLLPSELADLEIAELKAHGQIMANLKVEQNEPLALGGETGFRVQIRILNADGVAFHQVWCGALHKGYFYLVSFHAPEVYYFPKYLPDFERALGSFRLM